MVKVTPRTRFEALLRNCQTEMDFLMKKEKVRKVAKNMGGQIDLYEVEGGYFNVRIGRMNGWNATPTYDRFPTYDRKFPLKNISMAAE